MSLQDEHDIATKRPDVKEAYIKLTDAITGARTAMTNQGKPDRCPRCGSDTPEVTLCFAEYPCSFNHSNCTDWWHNSSPVPAAAPNFRTITDPESGERIPIKNNAIEAAPQAESVPSINHGFTVTINCHNAGLALAYTPESLRMLVADVLEASNEFEEEIDFTLEVTRTYGQK